MDITKPTRINGDVLDFEDAVENLVKRETREEAGIEIKDGLAYINSVAFVRPDGIPVVLVKFAAKYKSGEVILEKGAFTDHAWVNVEEVKDYPCIDGVNEGDRENDRIYFTDFLMLQTTLCFLIRGDEVLLGMKKRSFGAGKWNGIGGRFSKGEDVTMRQYAK